MNEASKRTAILSADEIHHNSFLPTTVQNAFAIAHWKLHIKAFQQMNVLHPASSCYT